MVLHNKILRKIFDFIDYLLKSTGMKIRGCTRTQTKFYERDNLLPIGVF